MPKIGDFEWEVVYEACGSGCIITTSAWVCFFFEKVFVCRRFQISAKLFFYFRMRHDMNTQFVEQI